MRDSKHLKSVSLHQNKTCGKERNSKTMPVLVSDPSRAKQLSTEQALSAESWPRLMRKQSATDHSFAAGEPAVSRNGAWNDASGDDNVLAGVRFFWRALPIVLRKCEESSE